MQQEPKRAKVFWSGRSQAVRLPKEFRFAGDTVLVRREGKAIVLEPLDEWPEGYIEWLKTGPFPADFERPPQGEIQERDFKGVFDEKKKRPKR